MSEQGKEHYGLEPPDDDEREPSPAPAPATKGDDDEPESVKALDVCPNCGSPLGGVDVVVCTRCGFDMKTLRVLDIKKGVTEVGDDDEPADQAEPLCQPGAGDALLPLAMAGGSVALLMVGYLAGAGGLFAGDGAPDFMRRVEGIAQMLVRTSVLSLAGMGALFVLAAMLDTKVGNVRLAAARMVAICATAGLVTFFNIGGYKLETALEALFQAGLFIGLAAVLFRMTVRDAATLLGITICAVIGLLLISYVAMWSAPLVVPGGQSPPGS